MMITRFFLPVAVLLFVGGSASAQTPFEAISRSVSDMNRAVSLQIDAVRAAELRAAELKKQAETVEQQALAKAPDQALASVEDAKKKAAEAEAAAARAAGVPDAQKQALREKLQGFRDASKSAADGYSTAAMAVVVVGLALSLITALAGFMSFSKVAGALSIVVAAVIGIPQAIPLTERASYYKILEAQSYNVLLDAELRLHMSVDDYNDLLRQLKVLILYEAEKYPAGGDIGEVTRAMLNDLKAPSKPPQSASR